MKRRIFVLVVLCALVGPLLGGVMRARAAGSSDKPTLKVIVVLKAGANAGEVVGKLARGHAAGVYRYHYFSAVAATVSQSTLQALLKDGNVQNVVADHKVPAPKVPAVGKRHGQRAASHSRGRRLGGGPARIRGAASSPMPRTPGRSRSRASP